MRLFSLDMTNSIHLSIERNLYSHKLHTIEHNNKNWDNDTHHYKIQIKRILPVTLDLIGTATCNRKLKLKFSRKH